jgi:hypothetical protein
MDCAENNQFLHCKAKLWAIQSFAGVGMSVTVLQQRLARRLRWQKQAHMLEKQAVALQKPLKVLRHWQAERLAASFAHFLEDPRKRPAAEFFLSDLYGEIDFKQRDDEAAKILPKMTRLLPENLLMAAVDAIELSVLSHALDLRMAGVMRELAMNSTDMTFSDYQQVYRRVGLPRLRQKQIDLVRQIGYRLDAVVQKHGIAKLLAASRLPARLLGLQHLQNFLERGFTAFHHLGGANAFLAEIYEQETAIARRLQRGAANPFNPPFTA